MPKKIESKLDRYAESLQAMERENPPKTLAEMQSWLAQEGVTVVQSTISRFLESLRSSQAQERVLEMVVSGSAQCDEVDQAFAKHPEPQLETLIKLFKTLIFQLTVKGAADPEMLSLANTLTQTVCDFISGQTKAAFKERELTLDERKYEETKKDEWTKALEYSLEEEKEFPAVMELFRQAFLALKQARSGDKLAPPRGGDGPSPLPAQITNG